uniref:MyTH4 domain-containing protein n=1 Tax=Electrophorus electricus TaxID=8005 RepID=A0A4W4GAQ2_ELEEL
SLILYSDNELNVLGVQCFIRDLNALVVCWCRVVEHVKHFCVGCLYRESCARGWLLLHLVTGFFPCSNTLLPYMKRQLQSCSLDPSHPYHGKQRSLTYGGRRHIPSQAELEALLVSSNVWGNASNVLKSMCSPLVSYENFPQCLLFICSICTSFLDGEVRPIHPDEYPFDFLLDDGSIVFSFHRLAWQHPLHFDNDLYIEFHYQLALAHYLDGKLLLSGNSSSVQQQVAELAALQHLVMVKVILVTCVQYQSHDLLATLSLQITALTIPLEQVRSLRTLLPKKEKVPGVEINYGNASQVKTITFYLKQVQNLQDKKCNC